MAAPARRQRVLVLTATGVLVASGLLAGAGPAAAAPVAEGKAASYLTFTLNSADPNCSTPNADQATDVVFTSDTGTKSVSSTESATITDSADPTDVTTMTASALTTATVTSLGGSLGAIDVSTSVRASLQADQGPGTSCAAHVEAKGGVVALFTIAEPGWLSLTARKSPGGLMNVALASGIDVLTSYSLVVKSADSFRLFLPAAGEYQVLAQAGVGITTPDEPSDATDSTLSTRVHGEFLPAGAASGPARGSGAGFLSLGPRRSCATDTLAGTFSAKAGQLAKAQVFANGKLVATVRNPRPGSVVTLAKLADAEPVAVRAVVSTKAGRKASVTRSYVACS